MFVAMKYKFGVNGCLKNGVIELLKEEWLKLLHDDKPELSEQLEP